MRVDRHANPREQIRSLPERGSQLWRETAVILQTCLHWRVWPSLGNQRRFNRTSGKASRWWEGGLCLSYQLTIGGLTFLQPAGIAKVAVPVRSLVAEVSSAEITGDGPSAGWPRESIV